MCMALLFIVMLTQKCSMCRIAMACIWHQQKHSSKMRFDLCCCRDEERKWKVQAVSILHRLFAALKAQNIMGITGEVRDGASVPIIACKVQYGESTQVHTCSLQQA